MYPLLALSAENPTRHKLRSNWRYTDIFRQENPTEPGGFLYSWSSDTTWDIAYQRQSISCGYHVSDFQGELNKLVNRAGTISFEMPNRFLRLGYSMPLAQSTLQSHLDLGHDPGIGFAYESPAWHSSLKLNQQRAEVNYEIATDSGTIPFKWLFAELATGAASSTCSAELTLSAFIPIAQDSLYDNSLSSYQAAIGYEAQLCDRFRANLSANYLHSSARLRYKGDLYGKLDQLNLLSSSMAISHDTNHISCKLGLNTYHSRLGEDSYFDIWPFSAWDAFLAHRTRIKRFDLDSLSPFVGIHYQRKAEHTAGVSFTLGSTYNHHFGTESLLIRNRRVVLYPFLFSYEDLDFELMDRIDAHLQLNLGLSYSSGASAVKLDLTQLAPIKWDKIKDIDLDPGPSATKTRQWGGTSLSLSLSLGF
jgi:hypothetical protein